MRAIAHVVYALPQASAVWQTSGPRILRRLLEKIKNRTGYGPFSSTSISWPRPVNAPFSITKAIIETLEPDFEVKVYPVTQTGDLEVGKDDLVIGHLWPDMSTKSVHSNNWTRFDGGQILNRAVLKYGRTRKIIAISPFNSTPGQVDWMIPLLEKCPHYVAICGDVWQDALEDFADRIPNLSTHLLNMAVERTEYKQVKTDFGECGSRRFLYIGRVSEEKNTRMLSSLAKTCSDFRCDSISGEHIEGCKHIAPFARLEDAYVRGLAERYDCLISPSRADAQATTVLEAMCWGFMICASRESGYSHDSFFLLDVQNLDKNIELVRKFQNATLDELLARQRRNHQLVASKYSWETFRENISSVVGKCFS